MTVAPTLGHRAATAPGDALPGVLAHVAKAWLTFHIHGMGGGPSGVTWRSDLGSMGGTMRGWGDRPFPDRRLPAATRGAVA